MLMNDSTLHLFIDDSGVRLPNREHTQPRNDKLDYFALGGVIVKPEDRSQIRNAYDKLRTKYGMDYALHSSCIRSKKKDFRWLGTDEAKEKRFLNDLWRFICSQPIIVHACVVHRPGYNARYEKEYGKSRWDLCKSAYSILVERAAKYALRENRKLLVYVEETGRIEDRLIKEYHKHLLDEGPYFDQHTSAKYTPLDSGGFSHTLARNPNFTTKNHFLTQLADLVLFPVVKEIYEPNYRSFVSMHNAGLIIDQHLSEDEQKTIGVKYYCFDDPNKSKKAPEGASRPPS